MKESVLITKPANNTARRIFVAATRQNEGKTTTSLGLFGALKNYYSKVGYIKPVAQRLIEISGVKVDEDSYLLDSIYHVEVPYESMSPITVDSQFTRRFLGDPSIRNVLIDRMCRAFDNAAENKEICIIEGSGHAGVGAIFDLSNAQVAKILDAKAIIVTQGGIGRPIDEIALNKALFDKHNVTVIGAILNKVAPNKTEEIAKYAGKALEQLGVPLLGILPKQNELTAPNLAQVVQEVCGKWLNGRGVGANNRISKVVIGAMSAKGLIEHLEPGTLIVTPGDREDILLSAIAISGLSKEYQISGIILTRNLVPSPKIMEMLSLTDIPVVICKSESYAVASKINTMTVKTQPQDSDKIPLIKKLVMNNIDVQQLLKAF